MPRTASAIGDAVSEGELGLLPGAPEDIRAIICTRKLAAVVAQTRTDAGSARPSANVAVVVLSYEGRQMTLDCLQSVIASVPAHDVVVVDNASSDGTCEAVRAAYPDVTVVALRDNRGYAGGNNAGIRHALHAGAEYVLILNNDTLVEPGSIQRLARALGEHPEAGAVAPLITYAEPSDRIWSAGASYDPKRLLRPGRMDGYRQHVSAAGPLREIDRFTGAAVMFPRDILEGNGGFDEQLFFLYEDVDLSLRIRQTQKKLLLVPEAVVRHRVAMTHGGEHSAASFYFGTRNELLVADRFSPRPGPGRLLRTLAVVAFHLMRVRHAPARRDAVRATFAGARDYLAGVTGPRPER
jgi:GT2 family glycosyltransferase